MPWGIENKCIESSDAKRLQWNLYYMWFFANSPISVTVLCPKQNHRSRSQSLETERRADKQLPSSSGGIGLNVHAVASIWHRRFLNCKLCDGCQVLCDVIMRIAYCLQLYDSNGKKWDESNGQKYTSWKLLRRASAIIQKSGHRVAMSSISESILAPMQWFYRSILTEWA